jgi:hypothetical protein
MSRLDFLKGSSIVMSIESRVENSNTKALRHEIFVCRFIVPLFL